MVLACLALKVQMALPGRLPVRLPVRLPLLGHQDAGTPERRHAGTVHLPAAPVHKPLLGYWDTGTPERRHAGTSHILVALVGETWWSSRRAIVTPLASWKAVAPATPCAAQEVGG